MSVYICLFTVCVFVYTGDSTALHEACCEANDEAAQLLIHYGADVNIADVSGRTALHWACTVDSTHCLQVVSTLLPQFTVSRVTVQ